MATYYGYVDRDVDAQINWAEIGKTISDNFKAEAESREKKKAAIDQSTRDMLKSLATPPQGLDETKNQQAVKYSQDMSNFLLTQQKLLKAGQIDPKNYLLTLQNTTDSTNQMYDAFDNYQANFKEIMERADNNNSQEFELAAAAEAEKFSNFSVYQPVINADGTVSMAKKIKTIVDGKEVVTISSDPNDIMPVNYINSLLSRRYDRFKSVETARGLSEGLATFVETQIKDPSLSSVGRVRAIESVRNSKEYKNTIRNLASGALTDWNMMSYLTGEMSKDPKNKPYKIVFNKQEADQDPNNILVQMEAGRWTPKFTDKQREAAIEAFGKNIEQYIGEKESIQTTGQLSDWRQQPQQWQYEANKNKQFSTDYGRNIGILLTGNDDQANGAIATLNASTGLNWYRDPRAQTITFRDPNSKIPPQTFSLKNTTPQRLGEQILVATNKVAGIDQAAAKSGLRSGTFSNKINTTAEYKSDNPSYSQGRRPKPGSLNPTGK